jgi:3-hydroxybutyryl-CoA dehydrogenase
MPKERNMETVDDGAPRNIGVLGAGVMGVGVAQTMAQAGYQVILIDVSDAVLEQARGELRKNVRLGGLFGKPRSQPQADVLGRIEFTTDYDRLEEADWIIENVSEKWEVKKEAYTRIRDLRRPDTFIGVNTSVISIGRIASLARDAARVIGLHFMNPVQLSVAVEVIHGFHTSDATIEAASHLIQSIGKESILVNDFPGFVSNRVLMLMINEAIWVVQDQVAEPEEVDRIFKRCVGHKMGPLETADLIGLDTILFSIEELYESYRDPKFRACPLLRKMVDAGLYGRKSGVGFYKY